MKEYNIKVTDTEIYINDKLCYFAADMDKENKEDDLNKKAILALADEMGYEATFLFEEMADRLWEMLDEIEEEEIDTMYHDASEEELRKMGAFDNLNDTSPETKRWDALPDIDNETVKIWLDALLESKNKMFVEELTAEEIRAEIEENKGSIDNFRMWGDKHAIIDCEEYMEVLEEMLNNKEE